MPKQNEAPEWMGKPLDETIEKAMKPKFKKSIAGNSITGFFIVLSVVFIPFILSMGGGRYGTETSLSYHSWLLFIIAIATVMISARLKTIIQLLEERL